MVATYNISTANSSAIVKNLTGATMVDWGDGSEIEDISSVTTYKHTYTSTGVFVAKFYGNITELGYETFNSSRWLIDVVVPRSVVKIGERCAYGCVNLQSIKIGEFVSHFGARPFVGATKLKLLEILALIPPTSDGWICQSGATGPKIIVPHISLEAYKTASDWSDYASQIDAYAMASDIDNINTELTNIIEGEGV